MKVKASLRFRGREIMHQEFGRQVMERFIRELAPFGTPIEAPRLLGRGLNVMVNPLPRARRAKNPNAVGPETPDAAAEAGSPAPVPPENGPGPAGDVGSSTPTDAAGEPPAEFSNSPFAGLDGKLGDPAA